MPDRITKEQRSKNMSHIKGKDTSIEIKVRKYLYHHDKYVIYLEVTNHQHFLPFFPSPGHTDIFPRTKDSA